MLIDTKLKKNVATSTSAKLESATQFLRRAVKLMEAIIIAAISAGAIIDVVIVLTANAEHLAKTVGI